MTDWVIGRARALTTQRRESAHADEIVDACAGQLGADALSMKTVFDVNALPYSKDDIKSALADRIKRTWRRIDRDRLKLSYVSLAYWQEGVGDEPISLIGTMVLAPGWESAPESEREDPQFRALLLRKTVGEEVESLYRDLERLAL